MRFVVRHMLYGEFFVAILFLKAGMIPFHKPKGVSVLQGDFFITQWVFLGMRWLYETLTGESIFLTILLSTVLIRCLTIFGDIKSRKSSAKMQAIQPQLNKLQKKYQNDPQKLSVEQRKLMRDNNVNMLGGCLPLLITMPIFFIFIAAFRQWGSEMMVKSLLTLEKDPEAGVEMFRKFHFLWVNNMWQPDNGFSPVIQPLETFFKNNPTLFKLLYFKENPEALSRMVELGFFVKNTDGSFALAQVTESLTQLYDSIFLPAENLYAGHNNGWFILPILAGATMYLSSWIMTRQQPKNDDNHAAAGTGKVMQYMFPLMSVWFCLTYNASFALYWTISSVVSIVTTFFINKAMQKEIEELSHMEVVS